MNRDNKKDSKSSTYFNYFCDMCGTYTKTSQKRHDEIMHYKGSFEKEVEERVYEVTDKRKSSKKNNSTPLFVVDKTSTPSQYDGDDSKTQVESPKKRQKVDHLVTILFKYCFFAFSSTSLHFIFIHQLISFSDHRKKKYPSQMGVMLKKFLSMKALPPSSQLDSPNLLHSPIQVSLLLQRV